MKSNWFTIFVSFYCTAEWFIYMCVYMSVYLYICIDLHIHVYRLPRWPRVKNPSASAGGVGSIPGPGRSLGEGNGNPLQYSCLENPHGERSLAGYSLWGCRVRHNWATKRTFGTYIVTILNSGPLAQLTAKSIYWWGLWWRKVQHWLQEAKQGSGRSISDPPHLCLWFRDFFFKENKMAGVNHCFWCFCHIFKSQF